MVQVGSNPRNRVHCMLLSPTAVLWDEKLLMLSQSHSVHSKLHCHPVKKYFKSLIQYLKSMHNHLYSFSLSLLMVTQYLASKNRKCLHASPLLNAIIKIILFKIHDWNNSLFYKTLSKLFDNLALLSIRVFIFLLTREISQTLTWPPRQPDPISWGCDG